MKKLLPILFVLIISSCSPQDPQSTTSDKLIEPQSTTSDKLIEPQSTTSDKLIEPQSTTSDKLIERNNISYFGDSKNPFTGEIVDYYRQNLKMTGNYVDGKKEGQWDIFFHQPIDGEPVKEYEEFYTNGEKDGIFTRFNTNGDGGVRETTYYVKGEFEKKLFFRGSGIGKKIFHKNNRIYEITYRTANVDENYLGVIYCKITDKTTNKQVDLYNEQHTDGVRYLDKEKRSFETWKDCELNGESEEYWDGQIRSKGSYKNGEPTGEWIEYDSETGDPSKIINYKEGKEDGLVQNFYDNSSIIETKEFYTEGFRESYKYFNKGGNLTSETTYSRDGRTHHKRHTTFITSVFNNDHPDFYKVMGTKWKYIDRFCESGRWKENKDSDDFIDCLDDKRDLVEYNTDPITITTRSLKGKKDGLFEISDTVDGHVYTSINYSRDGKVGDYKITNKDGLVVYSVTCLKGGSDFVQYYNKFESRQYRQYPESGNCRKDGEEISYRRTPFTKDKEWYRYSEITYKDDQIINSKFYRDPFQKDELMNNSRKIIVPYKENEYTVEVIPYEGLIIKVIQN
jgi:antitoxin component YwqK of YwqJK toxin-antitoxin module